jgi:hypothetical protein
MGALKQHEIGLHERGFCTNPEYCFDPPANAVKYEVVPKLATAERVMRWELEQRAAQEEAHLIQCAVRLAEPGSLSELALCDQASYEAIRAQVLEVEAAAMERPEHPDADEFARSTSNASTEGGLPF